MVTCRLEWGNKIVGQLVRLSAPSMAEVVLFEDEAPGAGQALVATAFSGISAGTELTVYRGSNPYLARTWDPARRLFTSGTSSMTYPVDSFGYEEVGRVSAVGSPSDAALVGRLVWGAWGHRSSVLLPAGTASAQLMPEGAEAITGVFAKIGAIALNAVLDADVHVGESVVVFGAGVPGQIVAQLARLNGGEVTVVDPVASRREVALQLGARDAFDPSAQDVAALVREATGNRGADVVIEMTGNYGALHEAVRCAAYSSRVVVSGFFQGGADHLRLGEEFHHNRISIIGSQISGVAPHLQHRWDELRMSTTVLALARQGRLLLEELITDVVPAAEAPSAFAMLDEAPAGALQVVLDYGQS